MELIDEYGFFEETTPDQCKFLNHVAPFIEGGRVFNFTLHQGEPLTRTSANGFLTLKIEFEEASIGLVYNDFRTDGGSFGSDVSRRIIRFFDAMAAQSNPVVFVVNSMGVRIMEGREVFSNAFGIIPAVLRFKERNLFITGSIGKTLGLGALLFQIGHYRLAIRDKSLINLTGPDVLKLFFGEQFDFEKISSSRKHFEETGIIHDLCGDKEELLAKARALAHFCSPINGGSQQGDDETGRLFPSPDSFGPKTSSRALRDIIASIGREWMEIFYQMSGITRTFLVKRRGRILGVFINPPGNPDNMIDTRTLERYSQALDLFHALGAPVISFVDTPGADPREDLKNSGDIIPLMCKVAAKIISYPHGKMGIVLSRCFGGATILGFPKIFGSNRVYSLPGSNIGIMDEKIIDRLFAGSPRLLEQWNETQKRKPPNCADLIAQGAIDGFIEPDEVNETIDRFLSEVTPPATAVASAPWGYAAPAPSSSQGGPRNSPSISLSTGSSPCPR